MAGRSFNFLYILTMPFKHSMVSGRRDWCIIGEMCSYKSTCKRRWQRQRQRGNTKCVCAQLKFTIHSHIWFNKLCSRAHKTLTHCIESSRVKSNLVINYPLFMCISVFCHFESFFLLFQTANHFGNKQNPRLLLPSIEIMLKCLFAINFFRGWMWMSNISNV